MACQLSGQRETKSKACVARSLLSEELIQVDLQVCGGVPTYRETKHTVFS
jgi:hypothetical protein